MLRIVKGLLATGAVVCAMVAGGSASAWAASEPAPVEASVAGVEATTTTSAVGELTPEDQEFLAAANEFHCTLTIQYPHASTHVSGTVNVVGDVTCPITMNEMYLRVYLEKSGGGRWAGTPHDYFNVSYLKGNSATSCSNAPGTFRGLSSTIVHPPAGWTPAYQSEIKSSPWISLACGASFRAAGEPQTVTFDLPFVRESAAE